MDRLNFLKNMRLKSNEFNIIDVFDEYMVLYDIVNDYKIIECVYKENTFNVRTNSAEDAIAIYSRIRDNKYFKRFGELFIVEALQDSDSVNIKIYRDEL